MVAVAAVLYVIVTSSVTEMRSGCFMQDERAMGRLS